MGKSALERRRETRLQRDDLNVAIARDSGEFLDEGFVVHDISRGGLCLQMPLETEVGRELRIRLGLPSGALRTSCTVRWVEPDNLGSRCGLQFHDLGFFGSCRLRNFLEPHHLNLISALDKLLPPTVFGIAALALARYLGLELASWRQIRGLELPPSGTPLLKIAVGMFNLSPTGHSMLIATLPSLAVLSAIGIVTWLLFRA